MNINSAEFIKSVSAINDLPEKGVPEIVFVGRSNVGKSSLLNSLCARKGLAKTSAAPGKTRLINYFLINNTFYFVDLPGYGYAAVGHSEKDAWGKLLTTYIQGEHPISIIVLLIDSRHPGMDADIDMINYLDYCDRPYGIVLTKFDKLTQGEMSRARRIMESCTPSAKFIVNYSAFTGRGRSELLDHLDQYIR
jgi:GTP-binding protein